MRLRQRIQRETDAFEAAHFSDAMIALHIRGPGRVGDVPEMRRALGDANEVPVEPFFEAIDRILREHPAARILACSDSAAVMRSVRTRHGSRVLSWPALRSEFGEIHAAHPKNSGLGFLGYRLGLDVVTEAYLLAIKAILFRENLFLNLYTVT